MAPGKGNGNEFGVLGNLAPPALSGTTPIGKRERKSNYITIDGHTIDKRNNYRVTNGEYIFGAMEGDGIEEGMYQKKKKSKPSGPKVVKPLTVEQKQEKIVKEKEKHNFIKHNDSVRKMTEEARIKRERFFKANLDNGISEFLEDSMIAKLRHPSISASVETPKPLNIQPYDLVGDMRDYQLMGLNWMVSLSEILSRPNTHTHPF